MGVGHIAATGSAALAVAAVLATGSAVAAPVPSGEGASQLALQEATQMESVLHRRRPRDGGSVIPRLAVALVLAASLAVAGMLDAQPVGATAPPVQYRDVVEVGADGNGFSAGSFVAEASDRVRYAAVVRAGPEVGRLSVTLNDTVVLSWGDRRPRRAAIPDGVVQDGDNRVVLTAAGAAGSSVRLRIIAERTAPQDPGPPPDHPPRFRGSVRVGNDGNGASAGSFEAHGADRTRFAAVVVNGPVAVQAVSLTVNATAVLASEDDLPERVPIPEGVIQDGDNRVVLSASGAPGSSARSRSWPCGPSHRRRARRTLTQLRARVRVGADGNGARAASFVADPADVTRYALAARPAEGLRSLSVTVNDSLVLVLEDDAPRRVPIPGGVVQAGDNRVLLAATGPADSTATVSIVAVRTSRTTPPGAGAAPAVPRACAWAPTATARSPRGSRRRSPRLATWRWSIASAALRAARRRSRTSTSC